ncbi:MAG TPA: 1-acyl-sn-glycerol-3-phosphate acyltransferase [Dissulfurispiraceae bacterium]|nr:1-acyl-sn-glycerol-3-phosphate acyltransferase [Dissulfurispiraceae bacterium]
MTLIRKVAKALVIFVICLSFLGIGAIVSIVFRPLPRFRSGVRARCTQLWATLVSAVLGIRIVQCGEVWPLVQNEAYFIVSNHVSYVDIIVLASVRPVAFLSKQDVKDWPILGRLASFAGTVFVNRHSRRAALPAMQEIEERIVHDVSVVVFPEGTTSDGLRLLEFKSTFFDLPVRARLPVLPVALRYMSVDGRTVPADVVPPVAWFGDVPLAPNVWQLFGMHELVVRVVAASPLRFSEDADSDRKRLAQEARARVAEAYWTPEDA